MHFPFRKKYVDGVYFCLKMTFKTLYIFTYLSL